MATTILTGRALEQYFAQQQAETSTPADACSAEPFAAADLDPDDALAEFLYPAARSPGNTDNTVLFSATELRTEKPATEPQTGAAG